MHPSVIKKAITRSLSAPSRALPTPLLADDSARRGPARARATPTMTCNAIRDNNHADETRGVSTAHAFLGLVVRGVACGARRGDLLQPAFLAALPAEQRDASWARSDAGRWPRFCVGTIPGLRSRCVAGLHAAGEPSARSTTRSPHAPHAPLNAEYQCMYRSTGERTTVTTCCARTGAWTVSIALSMFACVCSRWQQGGSVP